MATYQGPLTDPGGPAVPAIPSASSAPKTPARAAAEEALLDAAERLLAGPGYAAVTTRRLAEEAGVNHGLVHYYFGSNENLLVRALERFTGRLIARQRELYAAGLPFVEKWRTAMRYLMSEDVSYQKIWLELQALAWMVMTFNLGIIVERLGGIETGHRELLDWIDQWISR